MDNPSHPNDFYIPDGVTFVGTIHDPGLAKVNGSVTGEITYVDCGFNIMGMAAI